MTGAAIISVTASPDASGIGQRRIVLLYVAIFVVVVAPFFTVLVPPIGDYPNHLARADLLARYWQDAQLQANYVLQWKPSPYIAMDAILPQLAKLFGIYTAGRLFLAFSIGMTVIGLLWLRWSLFGRIGLWPLGMYLFLLNENVSLGFLTYVFGVGVWLVAFAAWVATAAWPRASRVLLSLALGLIVYSAHWFAFCGYLLCVATWECEVWWREKPRRLSSLLARAALAAVQIIAPLALLSTVLKGQEGFSTRYGYLSEKIEMLLSPVMFAGSLINSAIAIFALAVAVIGFASGKLRMTSMMRLPVIVMTLAMLMMPRVLTGVWATDLRLPFVLVLLVITATEPTKVSVRVRRAILAATILLICARSVAIAWAWQPLGLQYNELRSALGVVPRGARLLPVWLPGDGDTPLLHGSVTNYQHLPNLAVIERSAFVPYLFKLPMTTIQASPANAAIDSPHGQPIGLMDLLAGTDPQLSAVLSGTSNNEGETRWWADWPHRYDYALVFDFGSTPALPSMLKPVHRGSFFTIYRIAP